MKNGGDKTKSAISPQKIWWVKDFHWKLKLTKIQVEAEGDWLNIWKYQMDQTIGFNLSDLIAELNHLLNFADSCVCSNQYQV